MVVETAGAKAFQRLTAEHNALEASADALDAEHVQLAKAQVIADTLRVTG
ncbi:hypothetical protein ACP3P6_05195 [Enterobacter mori]